MSLAGKDTFLSLLGDVGRAVASGAEAGEEIDETSTGSLDLKVSIPNQYLAHRHWKVLMQHGSGIRDMRSVDTSDVNVVHWSC